MKLDFIAEQLNLQKQTSATNLSVDVMGGYISDLLSDVMAHAKKGDIWITLQIHQNTVAVATLKELAGVIVVNGKKPAQETIKKADEEGVPLFSSEKTAFELICELCKLGSL